MNSQTTQKTYKNLWPVQPYFVQSSENWDAEQKNFSSSTTITSNAEMECWDECDDPAYNPEEYYKNRKVPIPLQGYKMTKSKKKAHYEAEPKHGLALKQSTPWNVSSSTTITNNAEMECWDECDDPTYNPEEYYKNKKVLIPLQGYKMTKSEKKAHYEAERKR